MGEAAVERCLRSIVRHAHEAVPFHQEAMNRRGRRPGDVRTVRSGEGETRP